MKKYLLCFLFGSINFLFLAAQPKFKKGIADTFAKPVVINVPTVSHTITNGTNTKTIAPPEAKPTDFFVHMQNYTTEQGLALSSIASSYMDHFGNLWFGSYGGGVSRYDGKSFTTYTTAQGLAQNTVLSILEDKNGNMWFGTGRGVSKYDGKVFTTFSKAEGLGSNSIQSILEDKSGTMWFGTDGGGVFKYDGKSFAAYTKDQGLPDNKVLCILQDKKGDIWFGTDKGGASRYDGKSFTTICPADWFPSKSIRDIIEDKEGNLWFCTYGDGVTRYDGKTFKLFTSIDGLSKGFVKCALQDRNGNIWFGTYGGGAACYDGKTFTSFSTTQGLANNTVLSILEDKNGNIWFSTYGGGVSRYDGKAFATLSTAQGLGSNNVWTIFEDKTGNLWFGTSSSGVSKYDGKSIINYFSTHGLVNSSVKCVLQDSSGDLWFGTDGGISHFNGHSFTNYTTAQGLISNTVIHAFEDKKGILWFGTYAGGVSSFDGKSFTTLSETQGLANKNVRVISKDKNGNLLFCTTGGGVSRYDGKAFSVFSPAQSQNLANNNIRCILEDKSGNLWFGTSGGGVLRYDGKTFTTYNTADGISDNVVTQVIEDKDGRIYLGTNKGFTVITGYRNAQANSSDKNIAAVNSLSNEALKQYAPVIEIYNLETGYAVKDINTGQNCMLMDSKGYIWAGTGDDKTAVVRFDYKAIRKNPNPPQVVIQSIRINEKNICWYSLSPAKIDSNTLAQQEIMTLGKWLNSKDCDSIKKYFGNMQFDAISPYYPLPQHLVLPYSDNQITFDFAAIEPARPFMVRYQYILEGYDKEWSPVTEKTTAVFGNINEGTYTFKLKARSPDGIWSEPITYVFKVLPPWYRTWWFYGIEGIAAFVLLLSIYLWRTASLRKEKVVLEQTVLERTAEVVKKKNEIEEKQKEILDSIHYAQRIQKALLASDSLLKKNLPEYFVLYKPKDIVSGDFYWATLKDAKFYLAVCDSTGHGVPGAFMSLLNISFLNEAITEKNITQPNEVFNHTRKRLIENISQDGGQDGMDGILLCFDQAKLSFAAAYNAPIVVRDGKIIELHSDNIPVGSSPRENETFTHQTFDLQKGDILYVFTDGYADQFGGPKGKKFKYKQLQQLIIDNARLSMTEQRKMLDETLENWRGSLEQVDDVLVIGIRI